jgi:hypothetical protein
MAKKDKNPNRCMVCADHPINKDYVYSSGSFYFTDLGTKIFYCSDCLREPQIQERYRNERISNEINFPKTKAFGELPGWQKGPAGWAPLIVVISLFALLLIIGVSNYEPSESIPVPEISGEQQELDADNSIDGPAGTFDDQSKR